MAERWTKGPWRGRGAEWPPPTTPNLAGTGNWVAEGIPHHFAEENGAAGHQSTGQPHHLGSEILDGQVVLQHNTRQDGLQLRDARTWQKR